MFPASCSLTLLYFVTRPSRCIHPATRLHGPTSATLLAFWMKSCLLEGTACNYLTLELSTIDQRGESAFLQAAR